MIVPTFFGEPSGSKKYAAATGSLRKVLAPSSVSCAYSRGLKAKPFSASWIAGWNSAFHGSLPCCWCASSRARSVPGTPTDRPPTTPSMKPIGFPSFMNSSGVAAAGAVSRPSKACTVLPS